MGFDFHYMLELLPILLKYLGTTLEMASWGLVFALILALFLANIRVFKVPVLDPLSQLYISFFRGTPLLVQLFLLYYGLPQVFPLLVGLDAFSAAVIGLTLHFALTWRKAFAPRSSVLIAAKWKPAYPSE